MGRATEYWLLDRRTHQSMHSKLHRSWEERGNREDKVNPVGNVGLKPKSLTCVETRISQCWSRAHNAALEFMTIFLPESSKFSDGRHVAMNVTKEHLLSQ